MTVALAFFAKTSTLSPIKTRLAKETSIVFAESFYTYSLEAIKEIALEAKRLSANDIVPYWALAEKEALGLSQWQDFNCLWTGDGGLGNRLHHIYQHLQTRHDAVILMGTDSPQLLPEVIIQTIEKLKKHPDSCVVGSACDGGFYLFASKRPVEEKIWASVAYSQSTTFEQLHQNLTTEKIPIQLLTVERDVDRAKDLYFLMTDLEKRNYLLPAQQKLYVWLNHQMEVNSHMKKPCY